MRLNAIMKWLEIIKGLFQIWGYFSGEPGEGLISVLPGKAGFCINRKMVCLAMDPQHNANIPALFRSALGNNYCI